MKKFSIGIDLGGTRIKGLLLDNQGNILHQVIEPTRDGEGAVWKFAVAATVRQLQERSPDPLEGIGLSAPGLPDATNQCIQFMPGRMAGLEGLRWGDFLGEKAIVLNDAHAALLAEARFGAAKNLKNVVMLTLGTGVGGGILIDGKLYQGFFQKAGSLGHVSLDSDTTERDVTGMPGSIEAAIGNYNIEKRSNGRFTSTHELLDAYRAGDHWATFVWLTSVQKLAVHLAGLMNVFSPDAVILGGGIVQAGEALFGPLGAFLEHCEWRPGGHATPVLPAEHGDLAGALGAGSAVF